MKVTVLSVGKIKEKYLLEGIKDYMKRITPYAQVQEVQVMDEPASEQLSSAQQQEVKDKEGERLLKKIGSRDYVIVLDRSGVMYDSEHLAKHIEQQMVQGFSSFIWVIGGSLGLSEQVLKRSNLVVSFGKVTYPHGLMRLIVWEQIYRTFKIHRKEPYHK